jgi:hypothetical protein
MEQGEKEHMSGKRMMQRAVVCVLIVTLLPFARLAGFAIQPAHAIPMPVEMVFQPEFDSY